MRYFVRPLALAVITFVAIGAWVVQSEVNGSADIRPLSAAEQRATWGTEDCEREFLRWVNLCEGALSAPCQETASNATASNETASNDCTATCRDGCTPIVDREASLSGLEDQAFPLCKNCGSPGLGSTYNVRNCNAVTCCTGTIVGTFACNGVNEWIWISCGPGE